MHVRMMCGASPIADPVTQSETTNSFAPNRTTVGIDAVNFPAGAATQNEALFTSISTLVSP
jgi:hypothetical protein